LSSPDELRSYAVDCARLAQNATDPHEKARLLTMARNWTDLAGRLEQLGHVAENMPSLGSDPPSPDHRDRAERGQR
jgi:hypothetical protein